MLPSSSSSSASSVSSSLVLDSPAYTSVDSSSSLKSTFSWEANGRRLQEKGRDNRSFVVGRKWGSDVRALRRPPQSRASLHERRIPPNRRMYVVHVAAELSGAANVIGSAIVLDMCSRLVRALDLASCDCWPSIEPGVESRDVEQDKPDKPEAGCEWGTEAIRRNAIDAGDVPQPCG